ncbi:MAG: 4-(cytidine 5'-diphospho)-2-C-methyl-D-erythritol kinase [Proteobacteria bacterium]|nr:4-(cytidine 5'-diphospho)-2-C-methyl-D-erythritol kinase [Pseudomonadota bacterium]MBU1594567.1 4-(cytidine 5'-diphospho)-2-C-methyl-D-erythritol kinase [Pseudomonadota bacterium]
MTDRLTAPAKVNLSLSINGRRLNGYHDLASLFVPVAGLADTLEICPGAAGGGCLVQPELPGTPPERNLVFRAWKAYGQATGFAPDLSVVLTKRIPTGAGLGGGSSDAAAMLRWLQSRAGQRALGQPELVSLASDIGADVPFFLQDGPAWAQGIGDDLEPVALDLSAFTLLLVLPEVHVSTAWAFAAWDEFAAPRPAANVSARCLTTGTSTHKRRVSLSPLMVQNDFEAVVFPAHPDLRILKERLLRMGAASAFMSGSGAGLAGLFRECSLARKAADEFQSNGLSVHLEALRKWGVAKW